MPGRAAATNGDSRPECLHAKPFGRQRGTEWSHPSITWVTAGSCPTPGQHMSRAGAWRSSVPREALLESLAACCLSLPMALACWAPYYLLKIIKRLTFSRLPLTCHLYPPQFFQT